MLVVCCELQFKLLRRLVTQSLSQSRHTSTCAFATRGFQTLLSLQLLQTVQAKTTLSASPSPALTASIWPLPNCGGLTLCPRPRATCTSLGSPLSASSTAWTSTPYLWAWGRSPGEILLSWSTTNPSTSGETSTTTTGSTKVSILKIPCGLVVIYTRIQ